MNHSLIHNRTFVYLMIGGVIEGAGIWVSIIGNLQFMQSQIPSDLGKSLILMIGLLLGVFISPKAGVWADKYDKKKILIVSGLCRCLAPVVMLSAIYYQSIVIMLVSLVIMQVTASVYMPAVQAALPAVVPPASLLNANSISFNLVTFSRIGGTAIAGILVSAMSLYAVYVLSFFFYVILVIINTQLSIPNHNHSSAAKKKEKIRFNDVFKLISSDLSILITLVNIGVITLFLGGFNLLVLKFSEIQGTPALMGWIYTVEGGSILLVGLVAKRLIGSRNLVMSSLLFMFLFALAFVGMSFSESTVMVLGSYAIFGCAVAFFFPMTSTLFQVLIPSESQGRFFSFRGMVDRIMFQIALLATGACLDWFGISVYLVALAIVTAVVGCLSFIIVRRKSIDVRQTLHYETGQ